MADEEQDPFAFITENCRVSSSQDELLSIAKFAREGETFPDDDESPAVRAARASRRKLGGPDNPGVKRGGELAPGAANPGTPKNLGFRGERKGESSGTKLKGVVGVKREIEVQLKGVEREIEPQSKKYRVSPLVNRSGKMVIEGKNRDKAVMFSGDMKVDCLRSGARGCTEKLRIGGDNVHIEGERRTGNRAKKKLEIDLNIEAINVDDDEEEEIGEKGNVGKEVGEGSGKVKDDRKKEGDGEKTAREEEEEMIRRRGKRELPRSMFEVWGEGTGDVIVTKKRNVEGCSKEANVEGVKHVSKKANVEREKYVAKEANVKGGKHVAKEANVEGVKHVAKEANVEGVKHVAKEAIVEGVKHVAKEANVEVNRGEKSKSNEEGEKEAMRCILDALRRVVSEKCSKDNDDEEEEEEVDILETAKRCGMTFPRSRFLPEEND